MRSLLVVLFCLSIVLAEIGLGNAASCTECLKNGGKVAEEILKAALDITPVGTCAGMCELIHKAVNSTLAGDICMVACTAVGIDELKKHLNNTQLNYAFFCEEINDCPKEKGKASLVSATVSTPIILGKDIKIKAVVVDSSEVGVVQFKFDCPQNKTNSTVELQLWTPLKLGSWEVDWEIGTGKPWIVGKYFCKIRVCNTICDAFPKGEELGKKELDFVIKKPNK
ncbi:hypothetical protein LOD99_14884 [Oopsacas minuta]|uniref:Uncharacterized protein n=1 Tax=Oopsacas minuta TaxID=111878 RepID=A0AAV7KCN7_9METZ|nr:hypothetical protein LOD99_14884 [Oopsacas minuta]